MGHCGAGCSTEIEDLWQEHVKGVDSTVSDVSAKNRLHSATRGKGVGGTRQHLSTRLEFTQVDTTKDSSCNLGSERVPDAVFGLCSVLTL